MKLAGQELKPRERVLLTVLAVFAVVFLGRYLWPMLFEFARGGGGSAAGVQTIERSAVVRQPVAEVRLAALEVTGGEYEPERNLFRYGERPKPPPPPPKPPPKPVPVAPRVQGPPPQPAKPRPPPVDVSLIGILGPERLRVAVLTDGELIIDAVERQVIKDKFIVHRIGYESIDLKFVGFPDEAPARLEIGK